MNLSSLFGVLLGIGVMVGSLIETKMDLMFFLNFHGLVIVCGGTLAAASVGYPLPKLMALLKVFFLRVLGRNKVDFQGTIQEIAELNKKSSLGGSLIESIATVKHPFLKEAMTLVANGVLTEKELRQVLELRVQTTEDRYMKEANMFRSIGRFPPAFGLLAATLGMIALLQKVGQPGSEKMIGPAMSIGLVGTMYGIAIANFIFLPIAENLTQRTQEEIALRKLIVEGAVLVKSQTNPMTLKENLNSFLVPQERATYKKAA